MNIFFITDEIPFKGKSGSSVISYTWINYFLKMKHKVFIFIYPSRTVNLDRIFLKQLENYKKKKNLEIFFLENQIVKTSSFIFPSLKRYLNIEDEESIYKKLNEKILIFKPDVLFLYGLFSIYISRNIKGYKRFAPMCENPLRISIAKLRFQTNYKNFIFRIYDLFRSWFLMREISNIYNNCDLKGHSSEDFRKDFINRGVKKIKYYNHPFPEVSNLSNYKKSNKDNKIIVLIVGALSTVNWTQFKIIKKYILNKLEGINELNIEIRLVGSKRHEYFKKLYNSKFISCLGYVHKISDEFVNCDIFFSPTPIKLGLRVRLIEAMAYGKCLLISKYDQEAFPLLTHNYNCHVIKNINEAYEDLKYLINNPKLRNKLSMQARNDYLNFCSEDNSCSVYEKDIINLVKETKQSNA